MSIQLIVLLESQIINGYFILFYQESKPIKISTIITQLSIFLSKVAFFALSTMMLFCQMHLSTLFLSSRCIGPFIILKHTFVCLEILLILRSILYNQLIQPHLLTYNVLKIYLFPFKNLLRNLEIQWNPTFYPDNTCVFMRMFIFMQYNYSYGCIYS